MDFYEIGKLAEIDRLDIIRVTGGDVLDAGQNDGQKWMGLREQTENELQDDTDNSILKNRLAFLNGMLSALD